MFKIFNLIVAIFIAIFMAIVSFENLFFAESDFYILFWNFDTTVTWLILGSFIAGIIFGISVFVFLHSDPVGISSSGDNNDNDW